MKKSKKHYGKILLDWSCYLAGSVLFALSVNIFTAPNQIAPGGLTGIATLLNHLFGVPIGVMIMSMNLPLLVMAWRRHGWGFLLSTTVIIAGLSLLIDMTAPYIPPFHGDKIITVLFGGVVAGTGLGLIYMRGGTTGGSELIARFVSRWFPHVPVGRLILCVDAVVVASAAAVYRNVESALYAVIMIFVSSMLMDTIIYGRNKAKMMMVFTNKEKEVADRIIKKMERGVTFLDGEGAFSGTRRRILLCAVRPSEVYTLRTIVYEHDPNAFIVVTSADEVLGEGFNSAEK